MGCNDHRPGYHGSDREREHTRRDKLLSELGPISLEVLTVSDLVDLHAVIAKDEYRWKWVPALERLEAALPQIKRAQRSREYWRKTRASNARY